MTQPFVPQLAKPYVDVGLFTNAREAMLDFYQNTVGLPFEEALPTGGGVLQHRHSLNGSVFKLNHARAPLPEQPNSGYQQLHIASTRVTSSETFVDPDGNRVLLVPTGQNGIVGIQMDIWVRDTTAARRYYCDALGCTIIDSDPGLDIWRVQCGTTVLRLMGPTALPDGGKPASLAQGPMRAGGFRYLTIQVFDVDGTHAAVLAAGGSAGAEPRTLGDVARISFVRDPDGNWLEISQRKSLTGSLEPGNTGPLS